MIESRLFPSSPNGTGLARLGVPVRFWWPLAPSPFNRYFVVQLLFFCPEEDFVRSDGFVVAIHEEKSSNLNEKISIRFIDLFNLGLTWRPIRTTTMTPKWTTTTMATNHRPWVLKSSSNYRRPFRFHWMQSESETGSRKWNRKWTSDWIAGKKVKWNWASIFEFVPLDCSLQVINSSTSMSPNCPSAWSRSIVRLHY